MAGMSSATRRDLAADLADKGFEPVTPDGERGAVAFGQGRGDGQLIAHEERKAFEQNVDIAGHARHFARHAVEPGFEEIVDLLGRAPGQEILERIVDDPRLGALALRQHVKRGAQLRVDIEILPDLHQLRTRAAGRARCFH